MQSNPILASPLIKRGFRGVGSLHALRAQGSLGAWPEKKFVAF